MAVAEWGHGRRQEVGSPAELDALLEDVGAEARSTGKPQDVQVTMPRVGTLGIVVGDDRSVLNHIPADGDPPYMVSVGGEGGHEPFAFYVAGDHYSETLRRNTIPPEAARLAVHHFVATGELSPDVEWEEV